MSLAQRLQRNPLLLLGVGALLILAAVILVWLNLSSRRAPVEASVGARSDQSQTAIQSVLVASRSIARGAVITNDDVTLRGVVSPAPTGSYSEAAAAIGRVATGDILPSQIILGDMLSAEKLAAGVSALLPEGQRAFSIRVSEDQIIGGFLRVNDHVDVFVTLPGSVFPETTSAERREADKSRATLLLQNVTVLAVGEKLSTKGADAIGGVRTVSLAIAPEAVARLALADRLGKVALAIRNPSDMTTAPESSVSLADLGTGTTADAEAAPSSAPVARKAETIGGHRITIYSGATTTTVTTSR